MHNRTSRSNRGPCLTAFACAVLAVLLAACGTPQQREARYLESGKRQLQKKDYARAAIQFINASKVMPKDAEPYYQLALAYLAQRQYRPALASLQAAVKLNPKHQQAQLKLAELMTHSDDKDVVTKAQQKIQELINTAPPDAEMLDALAGAELRLGNPQDAEKHLQEAFAKFPRHLTSAVALAQIKRARNDLSGAEDVLKKAAAQPPPSANGFIALGQFYLSTGKPADAEAQFRRAIQLDPKSAAALLSLGTLQTRTGKLDDAEKTYALLSALPEKQYKPYHAAFLAARGKYPQAIAEFEKLRREQPDDRTIRTSLVREYIRTQQTGKAEALLAAVLSKNSKDADALQQRATLYLLKNQPDDAERDLNQVLHFRSDSADAHYLLATVHQMRGAGSSQRNELSEALRLRPGFLAARISLARAMLSSGNAQSAFDLMENVAKEQKNNIAAITQRNWTLLALDRNADARKEVDRALALVRTPELLTQDAYLKLRDKNYAAARASLTEALKKAPEDLTILRLILQSYVAEKQTAAAAAFLQQYAAEHTKSAPVQQFLAEFLMANGQRAQARTALLAAKTANPQFVKADISLAQLDAAEGHSADAIKRVSAVLARDPKNAMAQFLLANLEDQAGNHKPAVEAYKKVLDVQPSNVLALNNLAYDLAEYSNQPDEALKYAQKASSLAPDAPAVENTLGWVLYRKGLYSMALPHLEKAADKEPSARRKCHVAMAYFRMGDHDRAQKNLNAALKLDPSIPEIRAAQQMFEEAEGAR
jgi:tetratricopeptide (TPR) repeat protein